ncbi:MAG: hypothetical protein V1888_01755 [archaeon]
MWERVGILILLVCFSGNALAGNFSVDLLSPVDDYVFNSTVEDFNITFEYNVSGDFNVSYCNLSVNGSVVSSVNDSVLGNNSFSYLFEGNRTTHDSNFSYEWEVFCEDLNGTQVNSSAWNFKVNFRNTSLVEEFLIVVDIGDHSFVDFDLGDLDEIGFSIVFQNWTNGSNHFVYYESEGVNKSMISFRQKLDDNNQSLSEYLSGSFSSNVTRGNDIIRKNGAGGLFWSSGEYAVFLKDIAETPWDIVDAYLVKFPSDDVVVTVVPPSSGGGSSSSRSVVVEEVTGWGAPVNVSVNESLNDSDLEELIVEDAVEKDDDSFSLFSIRVGSDVSKAFWIALGLVLFLYLSVKKKK